MSKQDDKYLENVEDNTLENAEDAANQASVRVTNRREAWQKSVNQPAKKP